MMAKELWLEKLRLMEVVFKPLFASKEIACVKSVDDGERATAQLRDHWNLEIGMVVNLLAFLEDLGIKTFKIEGPEEFERICGFYSSHPFLALRANMSVDRFRFNTSNDLAHILFGLA